MTQPLRRRTSRLSVATVLALLLGFFAFGAPAHADEMEAPIPLADIVDVEISQTEVDVSEGPVDVTVRLSLADNESGNAPELAFIPEHVRLVDYYHYELDLIEGTEINGTWESTVTFPKDTIEDAWTVFAAGLTSNSFYLELGTVTVTGSADGSNGGPGLMKRFTDVTDMDAYYYYPVQWMVAQQITTGYQNGTFRPANPVTRGEAVTFLYRYAANEDLTAPEESGLIDVPPTHNFFEAISWATQNGVVNGYTDDTFRSGHNMTRGQVAAILYRQAEPEHTAPEESPFTDLTPESNQYEAITWLAENDITTGRTDGSFDPYANVTRAEIATFLERYNRVLNG